MVWNFIKKHRKKLAAAAIGASLIAGEASFGLASRTAGAALNSLGFLHSSNKGQFCEYLGDYERINAGLKGETFEEKADSWYNIFPATECLERWPLTASNGVEIKSSEGKIIARRHPTRKFVDIDDFPEPVKMAFILREDRRFYSNYGIDWFGKWKAVKSIFSGDRITGASGITEQVAKLAFTPRGRIAERRGLSGLSRKLLEEAYATELYHVLGRDRILEIYLNNAYLGNGNFGVAAAAKDYFDKDVKDVSFSEALFLAVVLKHPNYNPITEDGIKLQTERYKAFLNSLVNERLLSAEYKKEAGEIRIKERKRNGRIEISYDSAVKSIRDELLRYGVDLYDYIRAERKGQKNLWYENPGFGFSVSTTLDTRITSILKKAMDNNFRHRHANIASVVMDQNGRILATIGRRDYRTYADTHLGIEAWFEMASTIKPFIFGFAYDTGIFSPDDRMWDDKDSIDEPVGSLGIALPEVADPPRNWDRKYGRLMTLDEALVSSNNMISRRVYDTEIAQPRGFERLIKFIEAAGIDPSGYRKFGPYDRNNNSLGGRLSRVIDLAGAYTAFVNQGIAYRPSIIESVEFGDTVVIRERSGNRVFNNPEAVEDVRRSLEKIGRRFVRRLPEDIHIGLKTGTADETVHVWTAGFLEDKDRKYVFAFLALDERGKSLGEGLYASNIVVPVVRGFVKGIAPSVDFRHRQRRFEIEEGEEEVSLHDLCSRYFADENETMVQIENSGNYNLALIRSDMDSCAAKEFFGGPRWSYLKIFSGLASEELFERYSADLGRGSATAQMQLRYAAAAYRDIKLYSASEKDHAFAGRKLESLGEYLE